MLVTYFGLARRASQRARNITDHLSGDNSEDYVPSGEDETQSDSSIKPTDDEDDDLRGLSGDQALQVVRDMVSRFFIVGLLSTYLAGIGSRIRPYRSWIQHYMG